MARLSQQTYRLQAASPHRHTLTTAFQPQLITHNGPTFKTLINNVVCVLLWLFSASNPTVFHNCEDFRHVIQLQHIQGFKIVTSCPTVICSCWEQPHILLQNEKYKYMNYHHQLCSATQVTFMWTSQVPVFSEIKINGAVHEQTYDLLKVNVCCTSPPTLCDQILIGQSTWWHYFCQHKHLPLCIDTIKYVESFPACNKAVKEWLLSNLLLCTRTW